MRTLFLLAHLQLFAIIIFTQLIRTIFQVGRFNRWPVARFETGVLFSVASVFHGATTTARALGRYRHHRAAKNTLELSTYYLSLLDDRLGAELPLLVAERGYLRLGFGI